MLAKDLQGVSWRFQTKYARSNCGYALCRHFLCSLSIPRIILILAQVSIAPTRVSTADACGVYKYSSKKCNKILERDIVGNNYHLIRNIRYQRRGNFLRIFWRWLDQCPTPKPRVLCIARLASDWLVRLSLGYYKVDDLLSSLPLPMLLTPGKTRPFSFSFSLTTA